MNPFLWIFLYASIELLCYLLSYGSATGKIKKGEAIHIFIPCFAVTITALLLLFYFYQNMLLTYAILLAAALVFLLLLSYRGWQLIWLYFFTVLIPSVIQALVEYTAIPFMRQDPRENNMSTGLLLIKSIVLLALFVIYLLRVLFQKKRGEGSSSKTRIILFSTGLLCCIAMISANLLLIRGYEFSFEKRILLGLVNVLASIIFLAVSIWQGKLVEEKIEMEANQKALDAILRIQDAHLKDVLVRDEEMRRFRHDLRAHMSVVNSYVEKGDIHALQDYLGKMDTHISAGRGEIECGNSSVNALVNDMQKQMEDRGIHLMVTGSVLKREDIEDFDLCALLYNLLCNAMDECERRKAKDETVYLSLQAIMERTHIEVRNRCDMSDVEKITSLPTKKSDKLNHGLGSGNIERIVNKYHGSFTGRVEKGIFIAEVLL